ncbi:MAG: hypothetical protein HC926_05840 [Synechococcaceae cyanobacterium SM2_3_60]|nr:hypothetical protein [Synechococcaceae cyanobacterium SM2_3_60]
MAMDWELAYWRSEMLRLFKTEFLVKISHELRGPLNAQIGALELIKANLCDSIEEAQDYVAAALSKAHEHLELLQATIAIAKTDSPILPLEQVPVCLDMQTIYDLTHLHARDRGY